MTKIERDAIVAPVQGLLIYQTDELEGFYYYNGAPATWQSLKKDSDSDPKNEMELPSTANRGDMSYWDTTEWKVIPASANEGASLKMIGGIPTWVGGTPPPVIGDYHAGGVVFYIAPVPTDLDGDGIADTGLVCAINDQSAAIRWHNGANLNTNARATAMGTGWANTQAIINAQGATATNYAAGIAKAYQGGGHTNWFLPAKAELHKMYQHRALINATASQYGGSNLANDYYWNSTEYDSSFAQFQHFQYGSQSLNYKTNTYHVRAVRAF
jgi:hypothetical protein